jgi:hypothetical protein
MIGSRPSILSRYSLHLRKIIYAGYLELGHDHIISTT